MAKIEVQPPGRDRWLLSENGNILSPGRSAPKLSSLFPAIKCIDVNSFLVPTHVFFKLSIVKSVEVKILLQPLSFASTSISCHLP